jgi:hypothetical protein
MPFLTHEDAPVAEGTASWDRTLGATMLYHESEHGVIFDRIRVAESAYRALTSPEIANCEIDGKQRVGELRDWVAARLAALRLPPDRAAA